MRLILGEEVRLGADEDLTLLVEVVEVFIVLAPPQKRTEYLARVYGPQLPVFSIPLFH
jgi:hypothetical protein